MMKKFIHFVPILMFICCAAHHSLQPAGKGNWTANISVGGPVIAVFGTHMPIPYLTAGTTYGFRDRINLNGNLHLLPLAYQIAGLDIGAVWFPLKQKGWRPILGLQPRLMGLASLKDNVSERFRFYPIFTPSAAWRIKNGLFYTGMDWTFPLNAPDFNEDAPATLISPFCGYRWSLRNKFHLYTEIKWQGANLPSDKLAVDYWPIGGHGAFSTLISIERGF
ncbi:hypothetical protein JW835_05320 [bacterium]|nr:hypothetical protein [bacterium]